jgi:hypothetical protein
MIEFSHQQISTHEDVKRFADLLAKHHQIPARKRYDIRKKRASDNLDEESRYFRCIAGKESTIHYHYDVSTWIIDELVQIRIDAIAFYDSFQDAFEAATKQGATIHHFAPVRSVGATK